MKNSTYKNLSEILRTKGVLGVAAGLLLVSCGSQMGGYTETDGVYYDPNKDVIPEGIVMPEPNQVDEVYAYESDSASIIEQNQQNQAAQKNKYQTWNGTESDWGTYAGTEQNIYYNNYNTWGWNPYGYYSPYYGWGNGWNIGIGFGWNNWGWNNWGWNPYWGMGYSNVTTSQEGSLFIDIIDAKTKELVWQGEGTGSLTKNTDKKDARIKEFVSKILEQYPPK